MTKNYDEIYEEVQKYESQIQSMLGEKNVLTQQKTSYDKDLEKLEKECQEKFGCDLGNLTDKMNELEQEIDELFQQLETNIKSIE